MMKVCFLFSYFTVLFIWSLIFSVNCIIPHFTSSRGCDLAVLCGSYSLELEQLVHPFEFNDE